MQEPTVWPVVAAAIAAAGTDAHIDRLIDVIGVDVPHDVVTVTRYSASKPPEFVKHRQFSDLLVRQYLETYYVFDPFDAYWRRKRWLGVIPLRELAGDAAQRGQYRAEFLAQSSIRDEIGIFLADGDDWCLAIFLDRTATTFKDKEIALLNERLPVFTALHALDLKSRAPEFSRNGAPIRADAPSRREPVIPASLWPELSARERQLVQLILAGHPTATIAQRLGITVGTAKNHRRRIYEKLDITTERELFLQFFQHDAVRG